MEIISFFTALIFLQTILLSERSSLLYSSLFDSPQHEFSTKNVLTIVSAVALVYFGSD